MGISSGFMRHGHGLAFLVSAVLLTASASIACDTPVYRYAMYRWFPAPYEVYCFYRGEMDETGKQLKAAVDQAGEAEEAPTNIVFLAVNLDKDKDLTGVPPDVKEAWQKQENPTVPSYLVSSPRGAHLLQGSLTSKQVPAMIDSPVRQQIGKLIEAGNAGVYIFLKGEDANKNAEKEKVLRGVVDDVAAGKLELYTLPPMFGYGGADGDGAAESGDEESGEEENPYKLSMGLVTLSRDDAKEKWLIDSLLATEPDLRESKEPIVFLIYGRGRALFSCLGEGIHRDNLEQDVYFITGACSCTVKEQNPGVDLLMRYNWDKAAETLATQYGAEEGSGYDYGGDALFPELIIPPENDMAQDASDADTESADTAVAQVDTGTTSEVDPTLTQAADTAAAGAENEKDATSDSSAASTEVAAITPPPPVDHATADSDPASSSFHGIVWVGAGLLGALIVLFGATFVVLRPK